MIHHISHIDMDGVGCQIVSRHKFGDSVQFYNSDYENVDELIRKIIEQMHFDDSILITDISPSVEDVINHLDKLAEKGKVFLVDHHKTALEKLGDKSWVNVEVGECATKRLYHYYELSLAKLEKFVNMVNDHDMWIHDDPQSIRFNSLFWAIGLENFRNRFINSLSLKETEVETMIIEVNEKNNRDYVVKAANTAKFMEDEDGTPFAYVFAEKLAGDIGETLLTRHPEVKYVLVRNVQQESVSLRSRKGEYDVSALAKKRGGGGHQPASGYPLGNDNLLRME